MAANLAADGFTGPQTVIEGEAGFLKVFCTEWDMADLDTRSRQRVHDAETTSQRFPVHMTAHTAVQAVLELQAEHGFDAADVDRATVAGTERMATVNNIRDPADIMMAQYSIPFCVALALFRDPRDPRSFDDSALRDAAIRDMCARVSIVPATPTKVAGASIVTIQLKDGRSLTREVEEFNGTPARPLDRRELRDKFTTLTRVRCWCRGGGIVRVAAEPGERDRSRLDRRVISAGDGAIPGSNVLNRPLRFSSQARRCLAGANCDYIARQRSSAALKASAAS